MSNQDPPKNQLHLTFVEMLFALAIGQVAISLSKLIDYQLISIQTFWALVPAYSHLLLATVVISTSWVGWRNSKFSGTQIKHVFTWDYIELTVDVALVVMYFALARAVKIPDSANGTFFPNASFEATAVAIIFSTYAIWDLISCRTDKTKIRRRWWASLSCTIISWLLVGFGIGGTGTILAVLFGDVSLIALIFTFRAMKLHDLRKHGKSWILILFLLVLVLLFFFLSIKF